MALSSEIITTLRLDGKGFDKSLSSSSKNLLKFSAAAIGLGGTLAALAKSTAKYQDETIKAARTAGSTAESFASLKFAANLAAVSQDSLVKSLAKLNAPTKLMRKELDRIGVSFKKSSGEAKTQDEIIGDLADAFKKMENPVNQSATAFKLFGQRGVELVNFFKDGGQSIRDLQQEARELGLVFSEEAGQNAEIFNDNIVKLQSAVQGVSNSIGTAVIEFVNTNNIITSITEAIKDAVKWFNNLDKETKQSIVSAAALTAGLGATIAAIIGIQKAIEVFRGSLNKTTGLLGLAVTAFGLVVATIIKFRSQMKGLETIAETVGDVINDLTRIFEALKNVITGAFSNTGIGQLDSDLDELGDKADELTDKFSIFGTIVNIVFQAAALNVKTLVTPIRLIIKVIAGAVESIITLGKAASAALKGSFSEASALARVARDQFTEIGDAVVDDLKGLGDEWKNFAVGLFKGDFLVKQINDLRKNIKDLQKNVIDADEEVQKAVKPKKLDINIEPFRKSILEVEQSLEGAFGKKLQDQIDILKIQLEATFDPLKQLEIKAKIDTLEMKKATAEVMALASTIQATAGKAQVLTSAASGLADAISERFALAQKVAERDAAVRLALFQRAAEAEKKALEDSENEKLEALKKGFDDQIEALKNAENEKLRIVENAAAQRLAALDEEFQEAKSLEEQKFQEFIERETAKFEFEKELLLQKAIDKEQRQLTETLLDEDFRLFIENAEAEHEQRLSELASSFNEQRKSVDNQNKAERLQAENSNKAQIEALTNERNAALVAAEEEKDKKLNDLDKKQADQEKAIRRKQAEDAFNAQVAQFKATQATKAAETLVSGISAAAQAFNTLAGSIPFGIGAALGAAAAAAILVATAQRVANIRAQRPVRPPELFLQAGGVIGGNRRHTTGGINAELESGEAVIDRERTSQLMGFIDDLAPSNNNIVITIEPGAIQTGDSLIDESMVERFSELVAARMERFGFR